MCLRVRGTVYFWMLPVSNTALHRFVELLINDIPEKMQNKAVVKFVWMDWGTPRETITDIVVHQT
jgi:hypothetical protein